MALALAALVVPAPTASAAPPYVVDEASLPFDPLPGFDTQREFGVLGEAGYRIEVPADWNGELVLYAHGFVSSLQTELRVQNPPEGLRAELLRQGYAWAASSYSANGYAVEAGVEETQALVALVETEIGPVSRSYVAGVSMGGHITGVLIERYPGEHAGALPVCGVMGDAALYDYFQGHALVAQTLAGVEAGPPAPEDYLTRAVPQIGAALGYGPGVSLSGDGHQLAAVTEDLSGGERPLFDEAFEFWSDTAALSGLPFLLGVYGGALTGGPATTDYTFASTAGQAYQLDDDPALSVAEQALRAAVPATERTAPAPFPEITGSLGTGTEVLTMHTIGDLFVPFSMQQVYKREALAAGSSDRLVQRAIRATGHCAFSPDEYATAFADLTRWVETGAKPAGDDVLNPRTVRDRDYGCAFTVVQRPGLPVCGAAPETARVAGADRVATAAALAGTAGPAGTVVVASADSYPDALAGAPLTATLDARLLLTGRDGLAPVAAARVRDLGATRAVVLGGTAALSEQVVADLRAAGVTDVTRLGGVDRYATAALVAEQVGGERAFVVQGESADPMRGWPDAVAVSGLAAFVEQPVLLTRTDGLPAATRSALEALTPAAVTVVGGTDAVSADVASGLGDLAPLVTRVAGADRYGTSAAVARVGIGLGMQAGTTLLATGTAYADALAAGPVAAGTGGLLLLVDSDPATTEPTLALLAERRDRVDDLVVVGGDAAVPPAVVTAVQGLVG